MKSTHFMTRRLALLSISLLAAAPAVAHAAGEAAPASAQAAAAAEVPTGDPAREAIREKLKTIVIPSVKFENAKFEEALDALHTASKENDTTEADPEKRGIRLWGVRAKGTEVPRVTLKLQDVTLGEALSRLTELSGMALKIDGTGVAVVPKTPLAAAEPAPEVVESARRTIIALVDVSDEPLESVVAYLNEKSTAGKGPQITIGEGVDAQTKVKELRLKNSTLATTVALLGEATGYRVKVAGETLQMVPR